MPEDDPSDEGQIVWIMGKHGLLSQLWCDEDVDLWIESGNIMESCHECGVLMTASAANEIGHLCPKCRKRWDD